jgi:hypothetical protein
MTPVGQELVIRLGSPVEPGLDHFVALLQHAPLSVEGAAGFASVGAQHVGQSGQQSRQSGQQPGGQQDSPAAVWQQPVDDWGSPPPPSIARAPAPARHTPKQAEPSVIINRMGVSSK